MEHFSISELRKSEKFLKNISWDVTPKIFLQPEREGHKKKGEANSVWYMLYIDLIFDKPSIIIMKNKGSMSKTVGYIDEAPEDLLKEAMSCTEEECQAGMYPLTKNLRAWLKKALGI